MATLTYASETWLLKENMTNELMILETKIMRKIFGPTQEQMMPNGELKLIKK
jgi:hypothetical protein